MIRAEIRFKNSAFIKALEKNGYDSIAEFSRAVNVSYISLVEYANLRYIFKDIKVKVRIAELLNSDLHVLFDQYEKVVEKNKKNPRKIAREIPIEKMLSTTSKQVLQLESDYDINDSLNKDSLKIDINDAIYTLKDREKDVISMYFGLNGYKEQTLDEIGKEFGLSCERVRQIKEKAIRRLRHRSKSNKLRPYTSYKSEDLKFRRKISKKLNLKSVISSNDYSEMNLRKKNEEAKEYLKDLFKNNKKTEERK